MRTIGVGSWWSADFRFERGDTQQAGTRHVESRVGQPRSKHGPAGWHLVDPPALRRPPIDMSAVRASMGLFRA